ncbi:LCP family protein [Aeromicrobium sp. Marseille-Q0843]|uniref:LCP family protein n=1 Tax=Aeromicrobium phoceense TaxID=2754045 RepID=A0A838XDR6_9ACTN|nr:LCP family protein [Aeromicrobium phoceense]
MSALGTRPTRVAQRGGLRRALLLILGTVVWPGIAQFLAGARRLGAVVMILWVAAITAGLVMWFRFRPDRAQVIDWLTDPSVLQVARVAGLVLAIGWMFLFVDAWRLALVRSLGWWRLGVISVINVTIVALVTSTTYLGWNTVTASKDVVEQVFHETEVKSPLQGRYNILLLGADSGDDRTGLRPDSINLVSIDAETGVPVMVSLPRNLQNVPFPEDSPMRAVYPYGYNCGSECLLNAVHTAASGRPDLYPKSKDPGLDATLEAVEGVTGLKVNYYVLVNMKGFSSLVDATGGVTMDIKEPIAMFGKDDAWKQVYIQPGKQKLNGKEALWYGRSRVQSDDYTRMGRQKCLMQAMLEQLSPEQVVLNAGKIATSSAQMLSTDIPASELGAFGDLALKAKDRQIATLSVVPPEYSTVTPNFEQIRADVAKLVAKSERQQKKQAQQSSPTTATPTTEATTEAPTTEPTTKSPTEANNTEDLAASC